MDLLPPEQRRPRPRKLDVPQVVSGGKRASVEAQNEAAYKSYEANQSPCPNCGRTFNSDRLPIHLKSCRPGSTSKSVDAGAKPRAGSTQRESREPAPPPLSAMEQRVKEILAQVATDPEVIEALASNPKIKAAYDDVCANPSGFMAYVNDPDVAPLVMKMAAKMQAQQ